MLHTYMYNVIKVSNELLNYKPVTTKESQQNIVRTCTNNLDKYCTK